MLLTMAELEQRQVTCPSETTPPSSPSPVELGGAPNLRVPAQNPMKPISPVSFYRMVPKKPRIPHATRGENIAGMHIKPAPTHLYTPRIVFVQPLSFLHPLLSPQRWPQ